MRLLLVLPLLLAAACTGGDDDDDDALSHIVATITCSGAGCGATGTLRILVTEDGSATPVTITQPAITTSSSDPYVRSIDGLTSGQQYTVDAWLDVDTNGTIGTGDVTASSASPPTQAAEDAAVTITLDTVE